MPADDHVNLGVLQHVSHVKGPGHIGRRNHKRKDASAGLGRSAKDTLIDPPARPMRLEPLWFIDLVNLHGGETLNIAKVLSVFIRIHLWPYLRSNSYRTTPPAVATLSE